MPTHITASFLVNRHRNFASGRARPWTTFALLLTVTLSVFVGCKHTYEEVPLSSTGDPPPTLVSESALYVAIPLDAYYKKDVVFNSGTATADLIRETAARYVRRAYIARQPEASEQALQTARRAKCSYLIVPSILRWEDHATEFSGVRDRVEIKLQVFHVSTGELLHGVILKGTSRWMTEGGDKPLDLLREPVDKYLASLFHPLHTPSGLR